MTDEMISRREAMDGVCRAVCGEHFRRETCGMPCLTARILEGLPGMDLVRCRDCRSFDPSPGGWCMAHLRDTDPEDYCSFGTRRKEASP